MKSRFSEDPYKVLCDDPKKFCKELRTIFGEGLNPLFKTAARKLLDDYSLDQPRVKHFISRLENGEPVEDNFLELLVAASEKLVERIVPGAMLLKSRDRAGVIRLIEFAETSGGIEEHMFSRLGWAIRIGRVMVFGIKIADKCIPVAIYSRKYARFRQLANEWIKETSELLKASP